MLLLEMRMMQLIEAVVLIVGLAVCLLVDGTFDQSENSNRIREIHEILIGGKSESELSPDRVVELLEEAKTNYNRIQEDGRSYIMKYQEDLDRLASLNPEFSGGCNEQILDNQEVIGNLFKDHLHLREYISQCDEERRSVCLQTLSENLQSSTIEDVFESRMNMIKAHIRDKLPSGSKDWPIYEGVNMEYVASAVIADLKMMNMELDRDPNESWDSFLSKFPSYLKYRFRACNQLVHNLGPFLEVFSTLIGYDDRNNANPNHDLLNTNNIEQMNNVFICKSIINNGEAIFLMGKHSFIQHLDMVTKKPAKPIYLEQVDMALQILARQLPYRESLFGESHAPMMVKLTRIISYPDIQLYKCHKEHFDQFQADLEDTSRTWNERVEAFLRFHGNKQLELCAGPFDSLIEQIVAGFGRSLRLNLADLNKAVREHQQSNELNEDHIALGLPLYLEERARQQKGATNLQQTDQPMFQLLRQCEKVEQGLAHKLGYYESMKRIDVGKFSQHTRDWMNNLKICRQLSLNQ